MTSIVSICFFAFCFFGCFGCNEPEKLIHGTVRVSPELQKEISPTAVLYIMARPPGKTSGPPLAVRRFIQPLSFPIEFNITPQDAMMPGTPFEGKMELSARVAQNGSATPVGRDDLLGTTLSGAVSVGTRTADIELNLNKRNETK